MAGDIFLKLDGIKGESKDGKGHKDEIDVESFSWGLNQTGSAGFGGGGGTSKVNVGDLHITKRVDAASSALFLHCCNGKHIKQGILIARKAGEHPLEYLKIVMEEIIVTSVSPTGQGDQIGMESLSLNFAKFKVTYKEQKPDGTAGGAAEMGWDIKANKTL